MLLAAVFGRTARGRNANSPPCPDHHTRERKEQKQPDLHRLSIAQSGTGRCVKSARRINRHRPTIGGRGYRAISSALADPVAKVGNLDGAGAALSSSTTLQPMSLPYGGTSYPEIHSPPVLLRRRSRGSDAARAPVPSRLCSDRKPKGYGSRRPARTSWTMASWVPR